MSLCVPPRMPSPQLVPAPLPSPPAFPRRISSRSRLHLPSNLNEPPIPPRLVGSPLLEKLTHQQPCAISPKAQQQLWFDGDEFGTRRSGSSQSELLASPASSASPPSTPRTNSSRRSHRRSPSVAYNRRTRSHSPPPPPQSTVVPPPVPPIPSSAFDSPGAKRPVLRTSMTPSRAPTTQIIIPDLVSASPPSALSYASRTISPRRRGLGFAYGEEPTYAWRPVEKHYARGRTQRPGAK
ncbi:hypothetical protein C8Q77DRAFT_1153780 [Trametes polyzona]|nr:hypothetical protein C8Q77DRAFT_1153780 [Trametes polyzona]